MRFPFAVGLMLLPALASAQGYGPALPPAPPPPPQAEPYGPVPPAPEPGPAAPSGGLVDEGHDAPQPVGPPPDDVMVGDPMALEQSVTPEERSGLVLGLGLGLGAVRTDGNFDATRYFGLGFTASVGYMFAPRIAGLVELWYSGGSHPDQSNVGGQIFGLGVAVRWFAPLEATIGTGLWLQGGLSSATFQIVNGAGDPSASGGELTLGIGTELVKLGPVVLDLEARLGFGSISGSGQDADFRQGSVLLGGTVY